jgi:ubiquinone/menaquinone biosynthesis C-methylase UbiE
MTQNMSHVKKGWLFAKARERIPERNYGITGDLEPPAYDKMLRFVRDGGWMPTKHILHDISKGLVLEVGPGPGYLGLEWLKNTSQTRLIGYDISEDMLAIAKRNAENYGLMDRAKYKKGNVREMPFEDGYFDAVFSNDSVHEWADPIDAMNEITRVLKPGGKYFISDLRRDMNLFLKGLIWVMCRPKTMRPGWLTSIDASYTLSDIQVMLSKTKMTGWQVEQDVMRFYIRGGKSKM